MFYNQERDTERIAHTKKQERISVKNGNPSLGEVMENHYETWNIPGKGLYLVLRLGKTLYYNKWSTEL